MEKYFGNIIGMDIQVKSYQFISMSKSVVTMLLGKAIEQGYIESLDQPITDFCLNSKMMNSVEIVQL